MPLSCEHFWRKPARVGDSSGAAGDAAILALDDLGEVKVAHLHDSDQASRLVEACTKAIFQCTKQGAAVAAWHCERATEKQCLNKQAFSTTKS